METYVKEQKMVGGKMETAFSNMTDDMFDNIPEPQQPGPQNPGRFADPNPDNSGDSIPAIPEDGSGASIPQTESELNADDDDGDDDDDDDGDGDDDDDDDEEEDEENEDSQNEGGSGGEV